MVKVTQSYTQGNKTSNTRQIVSPMNIKYHLTLNNSYALNP